MKNVLLNLKEKCWHEQQGSRFLRATSTKQENELRLKLSSHDKNYFVKATYVTVTVKYVQIFLEYYNVHSKKETKNTPAIIFFYQKKDSI